ncbi:MAG: hypothetical protein N2255_10000, partial [Kiritimatiellae bacterium]|nr:hypothetical protein [Kiritimatiellia bacterium]
VYVLAGAKNVELVKFANRTGAEPVARIFLKSYEGIPPTMRPVIALDDRAEPPVIWCSVNMTRIEDLGERFGEPVQILSRERIGESAMASVMELSVDRERHLLYVNNARCYDTETGESRSFTLGKGRMWPTSNPGSASGIVGRDGFYYVHGGAREAAVARYDAQLAFVPYEVSAKNDGRVWGYAKNRSQGHTADERGNLYVFWKKCGTVTRSNDFHRAAVLSKYDATGKLLAPALIDCQTPGIASPRTDRAGNIYVAAAVRPGTKTIPPELEGQVFEGPYDPEAVNGVNNYPMIYGSVIKFGPDGGEIREDVDGVVCNYAYGNPIRVKGAKWIVPGVSVTPGWSTPKRGPGTTISCLCESPCLDVDGFGRVYYPDAGRARIGVLDTAGNKICNIGRYGNPDSQDLAFWWPQAVAVDERRLYVGDRLNRRVVVARLEYTTEATVDLDIPPARGIGGPERR